MVDTLIPDGADFVQDTSVTFVKYTKEEKKGHKLSDPPAFVPALIRVTFVTILVTMLIAACSILVRHYRIEEGSKYLGLHQSAVERHSIVMRHNRDIIQELTGQWYVQATNHWSSVSVMNSRLTFNSNGKDRFVVQWDWYNYYIYSAWQRTFEVHQKDVFNVNVLNAGLLNPFFCKDQPFVVLDYEKDHYVILLSGSTPLIPEGGLIVLTRKERNSMELHTHARNIAQQYRANLFQYTHVPQITNGTSDFLYALGDQIWKLALFSLLLFIIVSNLMPHDVTTLQSFSYSAIFSWNFGREKFHLILVSFCSYHQSYFAMFTHLTVLPDMIIWYPVVAAWGLEYLLALVTLQILQLISYKEPKFAFITFCTYLFFACLGYNLTRYEYCCRMLVFASAVIKVLGHATENFPPPLSGSEDFVRLDNLRFPIQLKVPFVVFFGIISEMGTGMPTRNFTSAFYILLCKLGYSSPSFMPLEKCLELDQAIQKHGWKAYPDLKNAIESQTGLLQFSG